jgi:hypothetical protein
VECSNEAKEAVQTFQKKRHEKSCLEQTKLVSCDKAFWYERFRRNVRLKGPPSEKSFTEINTVQDSRSSHRDSSFYEERDSDRRCETSVEKLMSQ